MPAPSGSMRLGRHCRRRLARLCRGDDKLERRRNHPQAVGAEEHAARWVGTHVALHSRKHHVLLEGLEVRAREQKVEDIARNLVLAALEHAHKLGHGEPRNTRRQLRRQPLFDCPLVRSEVIHVLEFVLFARLEAAAVLCAERREELLELGVHHHLF
eukprot:Amastigsp_a340899_167.p2 type:complete len:157 gc:universal Amastigsp_a340899_167:608-138(-)